jgi:uncharacterized protein DUF3987
MRQLGMRSKRASRITDPMRLRELDIGPGKPFSPFCRFQGTRHIGPWSDIDPSLVENGGDGGGPPFPLDLLPLPWRAWIADTARATGAPVDYVMQSVLAAVAGVCGAGVVARVSESWTEPLVLWQALVGRRSSGKSCALAPMHCLLAGLEAELKESDPGGDPRIVTTDPDSTAVSSRPQGVLLWRDDASSWFADLAEPARADDSGAISIVSVLGTMRPDRLLEALADGNDSFAAHFLYAWPDPPPYCRLVERRAPANEQAFALLRRISSATRTPEKPLVLAFDEAAVKAFDGFLTKLDVAWRTAEGLEADWMGKGSAQLSVLPASSSFWPGRAATPVARRGVPAAPLWKPPLGCGATTSARRPTSYSIAPVRPTCSARRAASCAGSRPTAGRRSRARISAVALSAEASMPAAPISC